MKWEAVIGLEVHVQLKTHSKIFSGSPTAYGAAPNTQACAIDLGMPGVLPVLNKEAVTLAVRFGTSINADIAPRSIFARKNYFYPDLPKGYQISQYELPIVGKGALNIKLADGSAKRIGITRAHLEEDAGKSVHENIIGCSGIDLNRAGTPLLEIVSEPDLRSAEEAIAYLKTLHNLVRYLEISDGNMQEGSFRCDVNVSLRPKGQTTLGTRTELKNLNSFRFIEKAIIHEISRQQKLLEEGGTIIQATRLYDPVKNETRPMRTKEEAHDYRYFPDPDLLPVAITPKFIDSIKEQLPELPWDKSDRFQREHHLSEFEANLLTNELATATFFEKVIEENKNVPAKLIANWLIGELAARLNKENMTLNELPVTAQQLSQLLLRIHDQTISRDIAKKVFDKMWHTALSADEMIEQDGLKQMNDSGALEKIIDEIIQQNPTQVTQFRAGKEKLIAFFVGQVMKATKGKANPTQVNALLVKKLQQ